MRRRRLATAAPAVHRRVPTKHPRHIVTEVGPIAEAFARARRVKPDVHVRDLVLLGAEAVVEQAKRERGDDERRAAAIERLIALTTDPDGIDHAAALEVGELRPELRHEH